LLHIVNKSPFDQNALETCLRFAKQGAAVLLIEERGLWALAGDLEHVLAHRDVRHWHVFEAASWALAASRMRAAPALATPSSRIKAGIAAEFLVRSARDDGSWPIDANLATWVTTLSINTLLDERSRADLPDTYDAEAMCVWLLKQEYHVEHPYTHAAPGGWAWTDLTGGVPDADDTAGTLLALYRLAASGRLDRETADRVGAAAERGAAWLLGLQNKDGGIPTFCRGWGKWPFDQSTPDLTAHTVRAWHTWRDVLPQRTARLLDVASAKALRCLLNMQRDDGTWVPLWFGNQHTPGQQNPTTVRRASCRFRHRSTWTNHALSNGEALGRMTRAGSLPRRARTVVGAVVRARRRRSRKRPWRSMPSRPWHSSFPAETSTAMAANHKRYAT